jgi:hypothetical protein
MRLRLILLGTAICLGASAPSALAVTTGHSKTLIVACPGGTGFTVDFNAFKGQRTEVTAFYNATGIACVLKDEAGNVLFDPSAQ